VNATKLKALAIPLLGLPAQRRIADILDKADAIRRKRKEAIALTEDLLRSAFLDMFGDPVTNPKGWPVKPLGELLAAPLRNGLSPATGGRFEAQVLTLSAVTRGQFDASASKPGAFAVEPREDVRVDARDFLICRGNGNVSLVGTAAYPRGSMKAIVFPDTMIAARIDRSRVCPAFINTIWKSRSVRRQIEAGARTTNGTFKINQTIVEGIEIVLPPLAKQQIFADLESRVVKNANNQHTAIERAEKLFKALVARAFSGSLETSQ
jgi:type I restriction enzyme S subunit